MKDKSLQHSTGMLLDAAAKYFGHATHKVQLLGNTKKKCCHNCESVLFYKGTYVRHIFKPNHQDENLAVIFLHMSWATYCIYFSTTHIVLHQHYMFINACMSH